MGTFFCLYMTAWAMMCLLAIAMYVKERDACFISHGAYWRLLFRPWKLTTFSVATTGMAVIAPYTGDPTWDYFDALFMAVLTFLTAPWAVGAFYRILRRRLPWRQGIVAFCLWMFSASWSYDLYLVFRDGRYPVTWDANIFLSSILYLSAGLMWNLDYREGRGVIFSFMERDWASPPSDRQFGKILWFAIPFMILVAVLILSFLLPP